MARKKMSDQSCVKLHLCYLENVQDFRDPRSHREGNTYLHFAQEDDDSLLSLILDGCLSRGATAVYGYHTVSAPNANMGGPCIMVNLVP